ncbi:uncharacterized protein LOC118506504 [Anopheles stephensi]|uniref:uncharacterized protein LOC118506504 n=1 Tax=Anopheles stephensi TaxID=30069 RepID=UPI00165878BC|nr:uncharacterized protein LOC118506504 [Anopheles stephensi]
MEEPKPQRKCRNLCNFCSLMLPAMEGQEGFVVEHTPVDMRIPAGQQLCSFTNVCFCCGKPAGAAGKAPNEQQQQQRAPVKLSYAEVTKRKPGAEHSKPIEQQGLLAQANKPKNQMEVKSSDTSANQPEAGSLKYQQKTPERNVEPAPTGHLGAESLQYQRSVGGKVVENVGPPEHQQPCVAQQYQRQNSGSQPAQHWPRYTNQQPDAHANYYRKSAGGKQPNHVGNAYEGRADQRSGEKNFARADHLGAASLKYQQGAGNNMHTANVAQRSKGRNMNMGHPGQQWHAYTNQQPERRNADGNWYRNAPVGNRPNLGGKANERPPWHGAPRTQPKHMSTPAPKPAGEQQTNNRHGKQQHSSKPNGPAAQQERMWHEEMIRLNPAPQQLDPARTWLRNIKNVNTSVPKEHEQEVEEAIARLDQTRQEVQAASLIPQQPVKEKCYRMDTISDDELQAIREKLDKLQQLRREQMQPQPLAKEAVGWRDRTHQELMAQQSGQQPIMRERAGDQQERSRQELNPMQTMGQQQPTPTELAIAQQYRSIPDGQQQMQLQQPMPAADRGNQLQPMQPNADVQELMRQQMERFRILQLLPTSEAQEKQRHEILAHQWELEKKIFSPEPPHQLMPLRPMACQMMPQQRMSRPSMPHQPRPLQPNLPQPMAHQMLPQQRMPQPHVTHQYRPPQPMMDQAMPRQSMQQQCMPLQTMPQQERQMMPQQPMAQPMIQQQPIYQQAASQQPIPQQATGCQQMPMSYQPTPYQTAQAQQRMPHYPMPQQPVAQNLVSGDASQPHQARLPYTNRLVEPSYGEWRNSTVSPRHTRLPYTNRLVDPSYDEWRNSTVPPSHPESYGTNGQLVPVQQARPVDQMQDRRPAVPYDGSPMNIYAQHGLPMVDDRQRAVSYSGMQQNAIQQAPVNRPANIYNPN